MYEYFHFTNDYYQSLNEEFKLDDKIRLKEEPANLYDVVKRMYDGSPNFSRVLTISRLEEYNSKKEKLTRDMIVNSISEEIKSSIQKPRNCFIVILGSQYVMVLLESSGEKLLDYLTGLNVAIQAGRSIQTNCLVLSFIEDTTNSMIPGWYIHETNISDGIMNEYKDKNKTEKTWVLYEKLCEFGSSLCGVIAKNDESLKKPIINNFSKFIPGSEDLKDIFSQDHITVEDFVRMYCDPMDIELDEELLWPYDWHLNL